MNLFKPGNRRVVAALAILAALAAVPAVVTGRAAEQSLQQETESTDSFTGVWQVKVKPDSAAAQAGKQEFGEMVLFEDGRLTASACAKYGFAPATYTLQNNGSAFSATMTLNGESLQWSGSLGSNGLSGTVIWSKPTGEVFRYTMSGARFEEDDGGEGNVGE